jgi:hypothetical protein
MLSRLLHRSAAPLRAAPLRRHATAWAGLSKSLREADPVMFDIVEREKKRQRDSLCLIASEVRARLRRARPHRRPPSARRRALDARALCAYVSRGE